MMGTAAANGQYCQVMAAFLRCLAPRYGEIQRDLRTEIDSWREQTHQTDQCRRIPNIVANLAVGFLLRIHLTE